MRFALLLSRSSKIKNFASLEYSNVKSLVLAEEGLREAAEIYSPNLALLLIKPGVQFWHLLGNFQKKIDDALTKMKLNGNISRQGFASRLLGGNFDPR